MQLAHWQQKFFQLRAYLAYWLEAVNEHSLHPPFAFQLYQEVIKPQGSEVPALEALRKRLLKNKQLLSIHELGAGSSYTSSKHRKIASIAQHSLTPARFSQLLYRLILFTGAQNILELGTSLGLNTLYMAAAAPQGQIHTIEGCPETAKLAKKHFQEMAGCCIHLHEGDIDSLLPELLKTELQRVDLAYLDANHRKVPTLQYFEWILPHLHENSVVVVDDIHWSAEMQESWKILCQHEAVSLSLDVYEAGLLFFRKGLKKQHYTLAW